MLLILAGGSWCIKVQLDLKSKFQDGQGYTVRHCREEKLLCEMTCSLFCLGHDCASSYHPHHLKSSALHSPSLGWLASIWGAGVHRMSVLVAVMSSCERI